ncbi:hypothetical protein [Nocardia tengchongensis]|uniref:hypothetical protein n=1 Tax=Nocardia tengchongensis TaxID=2055889 RepID=UPI0036BDAE93
MTQHRKQSIRGFPPARKHDEEGIEDSVNFLGVILSLLAIVALALTLVASGYGFIGWAVISGIAAAVLFLAGITVIGLEWRRRHRDSVLSPRLRQGH